MKKLVIFVFLLNIIFVQQLLAKVEKTVFGFSIDIPSNFLLANRNNYSQIEEFITNLSRREIRRTASGKQKIKQSIENVFQSLVGSSGQQNKEIIFYTKNLGEMFHIGYLEDENFLQTYKLLSQKDLEFFCKQVKENSYEDFKISNIDFCKQIKLNNKNLSNFIKVRGKATTKSNNKLDIFFYFLPFKNDTISIMFLCYKGCSDMEMGLLNMIETIK